MTRLGSNVMDTLHFYFSHTILIITPEKQNSQIYPSPCELPNSSVTVLNFKIPEHNLHKQKSQ